MRRRNAPTNRPAIEPPMTIARRPLDFAAILYAPHSTPQAVQRITKRTFDLGFRCTARSVALTCQKQTFCGAAKNVVIRSPRRRAPGAIYLRQMFWLNITLAILTFVLAIVAVSTFVQAIAVVNGWLG